MHERALFVLDSGLWMCITGAYGTSITVGQTDR